MHAVVVSHPGNQAMHRDLRSARGFCTRCGRGFVWDVE